MTIASSVVSDNGSLLSSLGGGIYNERGSTLTLTNVTVSHNTATGSNNGEGGGIYNFFGTMTITNSTVSNNTATSDDSGGGILNAGTMTITALSGTTPQPVAEAAAFPTEDSAPLPWPAATSVATPHPAAKAAASTISAS